MRGLRIFDVGQEGTNREYTQPLTNEIIDGIQLPAK